MKQVGNTVSLFPSNKQNIITK